MTELARAAKVVVAQRYGRAPRRTIAAGVSNGGYLVRWQLENHPELFVPRPRRPEPLWAYHAAVYWDLTQRIYREELDPAYDGALEAGTPFCAPDTPACDADYDYATRPPAVRRAVARTSLTGRIARPMITLHGTLDALLPIAQDSDVYAGMARQGREHLHRYYRVEGGNHVDWLYDVHPDLLRPILPCFRSAFAALEAWIAGHAPPADATLPRPASGDLANTRSLRG